MSPIDTTLEFRFKSSKQFHRFITLFADFQQTADTYFESSFRREFEDSNYVYIATVVGVTWTHNLTEIVQIVQSAESAEEEN